MSSKAHSCDFFNLQTAKSDRLHGKTVNSKKTRFSKKTVSLHSHQRSTNTQFTHYVEYLQARSALVSHIAKWRCGKSVCLDVQEHERREFLESSDQCVSRQWSGRFFRKLWVWWNRLNFYRSYGSHKRHWLVRAREGEGLLQILTYIWRAT